MKFLDKKFGISPNSGLLIILIMFISQHLLSIFIINKKEHTHNVMNVF